MSVGALTIDEESPTVGEPALGDHADGTPRSIGETPPKEVYPTSDLFDPSTTIRVVVMQNVVPVLATVGSFLAFEYLVLP